MFIEGENQLIIFKLNWIINWIKTVNSVQQIFIKNL